MKKYKPRFSMSRAFFLSSSFMLMVLSSCSNAGTGAAVGAVVGVGAGAAIGGGSGALIGGAVGAASGALIGAALDDTDRNNLQQSSPSTLDKLDKKQALNKQDIIHMTQAGLSDKVIIDQIHATDSKFSLSAQEIIDLKNQGVSQSVIDAMINT